MRILTGLALAISLAVLPACSLGGSSGLEEGSPAPFTRFTMMNGEGRHSGQLNGKTAVIAFWASWCSKSKNEIRKLEKLAREYRGRKDVVFLAVSIDRQDDLPVLQEKIKDLELQTLQLAFSGNDVYDEALLAFKTDVVPHFFVIGPGGIILSEGHSASGVERALKAAR